MAGPITIHDGELIVKDPADISVYIFDWDSEHLATAVIISTSMFTLTETDAIPAWLITDDYDIGDRVSRLAIAYICIAAHTSADPHQPPDGDYWLVLGAAVALTKDQESILAGTRKTQLRLTGGTLGQRYRIDNKILTNETPAQTKERSFELLVQDR